MATIKINTLVLLFSENVIKVTTLTPTYERVS